MYLKEKKQQNSIANFCINKPHLSREIERKK